MRVSGAEQLRILTSGTAQLLPGDQLREMVTAAASGERGPLRVKFGVDPTRPDLHLGHAVPLRKLRQFQQLGHTAVLVVGGFTAQVGDPSGRSSQRTVLSSDEVVANARTYLDQVGRVLLSERLEIVNNADWLAPMSCAEVLEMASRVTVAQILERDDFARRVAAGTPVSVMEMFYPVLQGQDSVAIGCDVEIGGTDQMFNLLMGRTLQQFAGQRPQVALTLPLLTGLDGVHKMSKSYDNYVAFEDSPETMYCKMRQVPKPLVGDYLRLTTDLHPDVVDGLLAELASGDVSLEEVTDRLAREVVALYYDAEAAAALPAMT
jgi:tyrosyl-tRNA synthetase